MIKLDIDKTVPYPESTEPDKAATLREDMQLAANTAAVLKGLGADIEDSPIAQEEADEVFAQFSEIAKKQFEDAMSDKPKRGRPRTRPEAPNASALMEKVPVVTNKLLDLAGCGDPRIEIKATEMLGKISDVGLFSEKTEITVTYNNVADIDEAIKDKIRKMMKLNSIDVPVMDFDMKKEFEDPEVIEDVTPKEPPEEDTIDV